MNIKLLITGGTGYLASNIACYLKKKENILLTSHNKPAVFSEIQHIKIKNNNFKILEKEIAKFQPMAIIHTAGLTNVEECEKKRKMAYTANYEFSKQISKISKKYKIKLIYISTDHLYDGKKSF